MLPRLILTTTASVGTVTISIFQVRKLRHSSKFAQLVGDATMDRSDLGQLKAAINDYAKLLLLQNSVGN